MDYLKQILVGLVLAASLTSLPLAPQPTLPGSRAQQSSSDHYVFIPLISAGGYTPAPLPPPLPAGDVPFHLPHLDYQDIVAERLIEMAVFWFGQITPSENYSDVRVAYNDEKLFVHAAVIDRLLWYDTTPSVNDLNQYDAVTLYLDPQPGANGATSTAAIRIVAQLAPEYVSRAGYQSVSRWNGSSWVAMNSSIVTSAGWRSDTGAFNDSGEDRGWFMSIQVPFRDAGLNGQPVDQSRWKMSMQLHDRDAVGATVPVKTWPTAADPNRSGSWKSVLFGPPVFQPPAGTPSGTTIIRQGTNGVVVPDATVGGGTMCGDGLRFWTEWGSKVWNNTPESQSANVQNQRDIADWACFSKYYLTFPLDSLPAGKTILSADLILHQFGNAGDWGVPRPPGRSLVQVLTVGDAWNPNTISWNNAPLPLENVSSTWVDPLQTYPGWPGVARTWDLSQAVTAAYQQQQPLRIVLYSADPGYHSGKYFHTSEVDDWAIEARPKLEIRWRNP